MMNKLKITTLIILLIAVQGVFAQVLEPVKWSFSTKDLPNNEAEVVFTAKIEKHWHLYSQFVPEGGPIATSFKFTPSADYKLIGKVVEPKPITEYDKNFEMNLQYFNNKVSFTQKIKRLSPKPFKIKGVLEFMTCDDEKCLPPAEVEFEFSLAPGTATTEIVDNTPAVTDTQTTSNNDTLLEQSDSTQKDTTSVQLISQGSEGGSTSLWTFFLLAFLGGLIAILTPCVFPMIPMTVSFFMNDSENKLKAKFQALFYGFSIIAIYTIIGTVVAFTLGANFANFLSTHWIPNVFFFIIFVVFAASFFGAFEMTLPSWMIN